MSTQFAFTQSFPSDPEQTFRMFTDTAYIEAKCAATGSMRTTAEVVEDPTGSVTITSTRVLPAEVPAVAKSFVGETIDVTEVQTWTAPDADGARTATVRVSFSGPLSFQGTMALHAHAGGTAVRTEGSFKAKVPFVGGQIEEVAAAQTERYLRAEEAIGSTWALG